MPPEIPERDYGISQDTRTQSRSIGRSQGGDRLHMRLVCHQACNASVRNGSFHLF